MVERENVVGGWLLFGCPIREQVAITPQANWSSGYHSYKGANYGVFEHPSDQENKLGAEQTLSIKEKPSKVKTAYLSLMSSSNH